MGLRILCVCCLSSCLAFILSFLSHSSLHPLTSSFSISTNLYQNRFPPPVFSMVPSPSPSAPSTTIPSSFLTRIRIGGAMIRSIIRISAVMTTGRGRGIRDLLAMDRGKGGIEMHIGKQCERCVSSIIGVVFRR